MKTELIVEIHHEQPFSPKIDVRTVAEQRIYNYLYAQGYEVTVNAKLASKIPVLEQPLSVEEYTELCKRWKEPV